jgi:hypothetical protein
MKHACGTTFATWAFLGLKPGQDADQRSVSQLVSQRRGAGSAIRVSGHCVRDYGYLLWRYVVLFHEAPFDCVRDGDHSRRSPTEPPGHQPRASAAPDGFGVFCDHEGHTGAHGGDRGRGGAGVDVGVHQVEAFLFGEPPELSPVSRADAAFDQLVEERSNRHVRFFKRLREIAVYGAGHGDLELLAAERHGQVNDVPLGPPDLERVDDQQQPNGRSLRS